jgi:hypothetical protein
MITSVSCAIWTSNAYSRTDTIYNLLMDFRNASRSQACFDDLSFGGGPAIIPAFFFGPALRKGLYI